MTELRGDLAVEQPRASQRRSGLFHAPGATVEHVERLVDGTLNLWLLFSGMERCPVATWTTSAESSWLRRSY